MPRRIITLAITNDYNELVSKTDQNSTIRYEIDYKHNNRYIIGISYPIYDSIKGILNVNSNFVSL